MTRISVNLDTQKVLRTLDEIGTKAKNKKALLSAIGEYMLGSIDSGFETETDPSGNPWQPLAPQTLERKIAEGRILKILQRTGLMRSRINYRVEGNRLIIGSSDGILARHQLGDGVPKREVLGIRQGDGEQIERIALKYLDLGL